jgi:molybdate transport system ATP-binding protein
VPDAAAPTLSVRVRRRLAGHGAAFTLDVAFEARPGITILFGPSGSGKSTTLQAIAGLQRPDEGRIALGGDVWYDGLGGVDRPVHHRHVAYVFQSLALFPHMTAVGNVCYGMARQLPRAEKRAQAIASLERLGVAHLADRKPRTFSGGEAQRVALARALAMAPRVVLLDEPFSALDRDLRIQLAGLVRGLVDDLGVPLVQVTHNHGEARAMGDHVIRLDRGRIVAEGRAEEILGDRPGEGRGERDDRERSGRLHDIGKTPMPELRRR